MMTVDRGRVYGVQSSIEVGVLKLPSSVIVVRASRPVPDARRRFDGPPVGVARARGDGVSIFNVRTSSGVTGVILLGWVEGFRTGGGGRGRFVKFVKATAGALAGHRRRRRPRGRRHHPRPPRCSTSNRFDARALIARTARYHRQLLLCRPRRPTPDPLALGSKLASTGDGGRYSPPSCVMTAAGRSYTVPGMQSSQAYEAALANLAPDLDRRCEPEDVAEVRRWAGSAAGFRSALPIRWGCSGAFCDEAGASLGQFGPI